MGLMKIVVRIWDLSFLSLHMLPLVSLFQQSTTFLWSQVRRTVKDISPVILISIKRARKGSLWINGSKVQHRQAWLMFAQFRHMPNPGDVP